MKSEFLETIRKVARIEEIISEHVVLRKSGVNLVGLCPFHGERTPSLNVSPVKQLFHCYGCKAGGDVFRFVMDIHSLSFPEAVTELAARTKTPLPREWSSKSSGVNQQELELAFRLNRFVAKFYRDELGRSEDAVAHLKKRGVSSETQTQFYLGLAPSGWDGLASHLAKGNAPIALAEKLGLIKKGQVQGHFDLFRNRLIFPILDERARICGFGGRSISNDTPKYLNSSESIAFQKSGVLFGLHQARPEIRETNTAVLVEGYFDVLALHSVGIKNVVATCGTALTDKHIHRLKKICDRIVILFDSDDAGQSAVLKSMETGLAQGTILYTAQIPSKLDPDEYVLAHGADALRDLVAKAEPILDREINRLVVAALAGPEAKTQAIRQIADWLSALSDPVGQGVRVREVTERLGVTPQILGQKEQVRPNRPQARRAMATKPPQKVSSRDRLLFRSLLEWDRFAPLWAKFFPNLPPGHSPESLFENEGVRAAASQLLENPRHPLVNPELSDLLVDSSALNESEVGAALEQSVHSGWARYSHQIREEMRAAEASHAQEDVDRLLQVYLDAQKKMKELNRIHDQRGSSPVN